MQKTYFSTTWLVCRPLEEKDICALQQIVAEPHIQQFFQIGDSASDFLNGLEECDCFPMGVYSGNDSQLIGYINGYVYNQSGKELLVEFFLTESFYRYDYVTNLLRGFARHCRRLGFRTLRFELDSSDRDVRFLYDMTDVDADPTEDYTDEWCGRKRYIQVFKMLL